jgi:hypothetical protein
MLKLKFYSEGYVEVLDVESPRPLLFEDSHQVRKFMFRGQVFWCPKEKRYGRIVDGVASWCGGDEVPAASVAVLSELTAVPNLDDVEELVLLVRVADAGEGQLAAEMLSGEPADLSKEFGNLRSVVF